MDLKIIPGIGPKRIELLQKLDINEVEDLLFHFPNRYEDLSKVTKIALALDHEYQYFRLECIQKGALKFFGKNKSRQSFFFQDETGKIEIVFFHMPYMNRQIRLGDERYVYGLFDKEKMVITNPRLYSLKEGNHKHIEPIYPLTKGISNTQLKKWIQKAFEFKRSQGAWDLPKPFLSHLSFRDDLELMYTLHFPKSMDLLTRAKRDFFFLKEAEALYLQEIVREEGAKKQSPLLKDVDYRPLLDLLPYHLTKDQEKVLTEIKEDLLSDKPMNRLLLGDVGSGKTIVAFLLAYLVLKNGYQVAMMAPTTVLARQHYEKAKELFTSLGIPVYLTLGSDHSQERKNIKEMMGSKIAFFIGSHSLFQMDKEYFRLALVICDEQHRFGVQERASFQEKALFPNILLLSATPIPRSLNLIFLGDLKLSRIQEGPKGRKEIQSFLVDPSYEKRVLDFILKEVKKKNQAYIVSPRIEDSEDDLSYWSLEKVEKRYKKYFGKKVRIRCLHGQMSDEEKDLLLRDFREGKFDILLSTTVIEVGVDVKQATIMLVLASEFFGLSTLHQLRGRIGRNELDSFCIFMVTRWTKANYSKLKILEESSDGYTIALKDLLLRGGGQRYGYKQHGIFSALEEGDKALREEVKLFVQDHPLQSLPLEFQRRMEEIRKKLASFTLN